MEYVRKIFYDTIVLALAGDVDAMNHILTEYMGEIRSKVRSMANSYSNESREEIVQETCICLTKTIRKRFKV